MTNHQYPIPPGDESDRIIDRMLQSLRSRDEGRYCLALRQLGGLLADEIRSRVLEAEQRFCVVCAAEDADDLAQGVLEGFEHRGVEKSSLFLRCYWNAESYEFDGLKLSAVSQQYREKTDGPHAFVFVAPLITEWGAVRSNVNRMLTDSPHARVFVAAPIVLAEAQKALELSFPRPDENKFDYVYFSSGERVGMENVVVSLGASVGARTEVGSMERTTKKLPEIVQRRMNERGLLRAAQVKSSP